MYNLEQDIWKCIIQNCQLFMVLNTQCSYFSMICLKYPLFIKWFLPTMGYTIFLAVVYITSLVPYLNRNFKSFIIKKIGIFSGNDTGVVGYFIGMHRYLRIQNVLKSKILFAELNNISIKKNSTKAVSYIHDNTLW